MALDDTQVKVLFFDVFGTCVDWRTTVTDTLWKTVRETLSTANPAVAPRIRTIANDMTHEQWGEVAQEWRMGYLKFTSEIAANPNKSYKTVDEIHLGSFLSILLARGLITPPPEDSPGSLSGKGSLWNDAEIKELNLVWHRLNPWPDTCQGIAEFNKKFHTCTLSNGNVSLLKDMVAHARMPFTHVFSAEMFQSYKPNAKVYLGGAEKMGLKPENCAMVAAHLDDLKFAKSNGLRTVYVARRGEEGHPELVNEDIPDVWVKEGEGGFVTVARHLGIAAGS